jgi:hypothetical protein
MIVTDRRDTPDQKPDDNRMPCNYCNSMRFVIDPLGKLKHCPSCSGGPVYVPTEKQENVAQQAKDYRTSKHGSAFGRMLVDMSHEEK